MKKVIFLLIAAVTLTSFGTNAHAQDLRWCVNDFGLCKAISLGRFPVFRGRNGL